MVAMVLCISMILIPLLKVNEQQQSHEDLKSKYLEGAKQQKELYNKVLELRGKLFGLDLLQ